VRQVVSPPVADKVRHMLLNVVDEGTALQAALNNYMLAGKTGTPRGTVRGRYVAGRYNPNFVGLFPGDNPQYVIVVKLTAPTSSIYAAATAAPVTKAILEAAVAAQNAALDRTKLAASVVAESRAETKPRSVEQMAAARPESLARIADTTAAADDGSVPFVVTLPLQPDVPAPRTARPVPDVRGLPLRDAVRSLHSAGFHVQLARGGADGAASTSPAAGVMEPAGSVVRLLYNY